VISAGGIAGSRQAAYGLTGCARSADNDISKPGEARRHLPGQQPSRGGHTNPGWRALYGMKMR